MHWGAFVRFGCMITLYVLEEILILCSREVFDRRARDRVLIEATDSFFSKYRSKGSGLEVFLNRPTPTLPHNLNPTSPPIPKSLMGINNINNYQNPVSTTTPIPASRADLQAGFKLAPPTKKPSISACLASSLQFFSLTEPP